MQVLVRAHVGILHHVLGFAVVVEYGARRAIDAQIVAAHEDLEQALFSGANASDDLLVRQRYRQGWDGFRGDSVGFFHHHEMSAGLPGSRGKIDF